MDQKKLTKGCVIAVLIFLALALAFSLICGDQLKYSSRATDKLSPTANPGELTADSLLEQRVRAKGDVLTGITLYAGTYGRQNTGRLILGIYQGDRLQAEASADVAGLADNAAFTVPLNLKLNGDEPLTLRITAPDSRPGNAITLFYGNSVSTARAQVETKLQEEELVRLNGEPLDGKLCIATETRTSSLFGQLYWYLVAAGFAALVLYCRDLLKKNQRGEPTLVLNVIIAFQRYNFLIKQLVARDFKTKYKRSVLGVLWSFLNPLLTMLVQYIVFSTLFRSNIPNFALYLLIGIVCFSYFSEATSLSLSSIVGNAGLITKVYVPKYLYPLTRVMSSTVNFFFALIPLFAVLLLTRTPLSWSFLLLPLPIICLFCLCLGVGMLLASSMVFFRDTQFLWSVVSMLWMYATPIFYPESILPQRLMPLFKCNPLYHVLRFIRTILMDGISPEPKAYLLMILACLVPLIIGAAVFKKTQDRFVLYI